MSVLNMYEEFRDKFPEITARADIEHIRQWGEVNPDFAYSWFDSLANLFNQEMSRGIDASKYKQQLEYIRAKYVSGDSEVKDCIDVSFVENLFWQVLPENASPYWQALPQILKELYLDFHSKAPA